jgi:hypothetical protein
MTSLTDVQITLQIWSQHNLKLQRYYYTILYIQTP